MATRSLTLSPLEHNHAGAEWNNTNHGTSATGNRPIYPTIPPGSSANTASLLPSEPLSAVERTQVLPKPARMHPPLQFMCGPLLRYDTVVDDVWYGAAMIVTADAGSQYSPTPFLSVTWDLAVRVPATPVVPTHDKISSPTSASFRRDRLPSRFSDVKPFNPDTLGERAPPLEQLDDDDAPPYSEVAGNTNGHARRPSRTRQNRTISGQEIWVYHGASGTFTFWRFMIEIPLSSVEMAVNYSVNNGTWIEFVVPAIGQNMRWAAHSVRESL